MLNSVEMNESMHWTPSWVPDLSTPNLEKSMIIPLNHACGWARGIVDFSVKGVLQIQGIHADSVSVVQPFNLSAVDGAGAYVVASELRRVVQSFSSGDLTFTDAKSHSLCKVLSCNQFSDFYIPPIIGLGSQSEAEAELTRILSKSTEAWSRLAYSTLSRIHDYCAGRSLFRTTKSFLGIGPRAIQPGDAVTILLGCFNPMVLRPAGQFQFQVVGETYCDGFMDCEALLGPLSNGWKLALKFSAENQAFYTGFLCSETGHWQPADPRLSHIPLPAGWEVKGHEIDEVDEAFINSATDEVTFCDPRLTPERLKERGVKVKQFCLI